MAGRRKDVSKSTSSVTFDLEAIPAPALLPPGDDKKSLLNLVQV